MSEGTDLLITDTQAVLRRHRRSSTTVAGVLGREIQGAVERVWLDARLHRPDESELGAWRVWGAVTTVAERTVEKP